MFLLPCSYNQYLTFENHAGDKFSDHELCGGGRFRLIAEHHWMHFLRFRFRVSTFLISLHVEAAIIFQNPVS